MGLKLVSICIVLTVGFATAYAADDKITIRLNDLTKVQATAPKTPKQRQDAVASSYGSDFIASTYGNTGGAGNSAGGLSGAGGAGNSGGSGNSGNSGSSGYNTGNNNNNGGGTGNTARPPPVSSACNEVQGSPLIGKCTFTTPRTGPVMGTLTLTQTDADTPVVVTGMIMGVMPSGPHGIHVHETGDFSMGCVSANEHYNPLNVTHGAPNDPPSKHHEGDMGNVQADASGNINVNFNMNPELTMYGMNSIVGRSIVVHALKDDEGKGGNMLSLMNGNSGARIGCCVIGYSLPRTAPIPS